MTCVGMKVYISSKPQEDQSGWMSYVNTATKQLTTYLPSPVTDMFNQGRAFAVCKLPNQGLKNVCAIARYVSVLFLIYIKIADR